MPLASGVDLSDSYKVSGLVCSVAFGALLGFLFGNVEPPYLGKCSSNPCWAFWFMCFGALFLAITFAPKPMAMHRFNAFLLVGAAVVVVVIGLKVTPKQLHEGGGAMVFFFLFTLGGPLLALIVTWAWHAIVGFSEPKNRTLPSRQIDDHAA
jgi:hypothetical protein